MFGFKTCQVVVESLECRRLLAGISSLTVTDAADSTNAVTATTTAAVSLNLNQNADLTGKIIISGATTPVRENVLWKIDPLNKTASSTSGTFADPVERRTVTLTPTSEDGSFDLLAGVDANGNKQLDSNEIVRTLHLHVLLQPINYSGVNDVLDTGNWLYWTNPNPSNVPVVVEHADDYERTHWSSLGASLEGRLWDQDYAPGYRLYATDRKASSQFVTFTAKYIGRLPDPAGVTSVVALNRTDVQLEIRNTGTASVELTRDGTAIAMITDPTVHTFVDKNVPAGTHHYQARTKNNLGYQQFPTPEVSVTLPPPPAIQPIQFDFERGSKGVQVHWVPGTSELNRYQIFRAEDRYFTKAVTLIHTVEPSDTSPTYIDYTVKKGIDYWYRVRAINDWSDGAFYGAGSEFAHLSKGTLTVSGNAADNKITVTSTSTRVMIDMDGTQRNFTRSKVKRIKLDAAGGFDLVQNQSDIASTIVGGSEDDTLVGGAGADFIDGGAGIDILTGRGGSDTLQGGEGDDLIRAKDHTVDLIFGGAGIDAAVFDRVKKYKDRMAEVESLMS